MADVGSESVGPYVTMAVACEKLLIERDGPISVIRIIDRITWPADLPPPDEQIPMGIPLAVVVIVKAGGFEGLVTVRLRAIRPDGTRVELEPYDVALTGGNSGANLGWQILFQSRVPGIHRFDVLLDGETHGRLAIEVAVRADESEAVLDSPSL